MANQRLDLLRQSIDECDKIIKDALVKRFDAVKKIKELKLTNSLPLVDVNREKTIFDDNNQYRYTWFLNNIYQTILNQSKIYQQATSGLIGKTLTYSYSQLIHQYFGNCNYQLFETSDPDKLLDDLPLQGANITTPFKQFFTPNPISVICEKQYLNQDIQAFAHFLDYHKINVENQNIIILGNGATAKTVESVLKDKGVKSISTIARTKRNDEFTFSEYQDLITHHRHPLGLAEIIINTTSQGVYPHLTTQRLIDLDFFTNLHTIIDLNYNPSRSCLLLDGEKRKIKTYNGLYMLIECARLSEQLFQKKAINENLNADIFKQIKNTKRNIVLIGMPYSGKTTIAQCISTVNLFPWFDTDYLIEQCNPTLHQNLEDENVQAQFRQLEHQTIEKLSHQVGIVIATGGGAILNEENMALLKQNGVVFFIDTPLHELTKRLDQSRPLARSVEQLNTLYQKRYQLYQQYCDYQVALRSDIPLEIAFEVIKLFIQDGELCKEKF